MRIFAFHLLNDLSGSPRVLSQVLKGLVEKNEQVTLVTSTKQDGFLTGIKGVEYIENRYVFRRNSILRMIQLIYSQLYTFFILFNKVQKNDIIYINTVLPFGGAILGKWKKCKVIYHIHETSMKPLWFKKLLFWILKKTTLEVVYVSNFLASEEKLNIKSTVVYNALDERFFDLSAIVQKDRKIPKVLMICSLKPYKGIFEFLALAKLNLNYEFELVLNANQEQIVQFFMETEISKNVTIYPSQKDVTTFYQNASILMNLSRPDEWVETFGLTVIESMAFGIPSIVPPVGGPAELVIDGKNGFKVSCYQLELLHKRLNQLVLDKELYSEMQTNCLIKSRTFSLDAQIDTIHTIFQNMETAASNDKRKQLIIN